MERNFLGLRCQNGPVMVKEEVADDSKNAALERSSGMQWSFSNKVSALPQFLSFKAPQENRPRKTVQDPLGTSTMMAISNSDAFDSNPKQFSSVIQKKLIPEKQPGYAMPVYPLQQFDAHTVHHHQEVKKFTLSNQHNQTIPATMNTPVLHSHLSTTCKNSFVSTIKPQSFGGVPIISPVSVLPSSSAVVGTTDLRNAPKSSTGPAQLTIFYAGTVNVYDDISPEKAQAIMLLAGNGSPPTQNNKSVSPAQVEGSTADCSTRNWPHITSFSGLPLPTPISVTIRSDSQCGGGSNSSNGLKIVKPVGALASTNSPSVHPIVISSIGSATNPAIPTAVPQARKASLARFLEKRKERVTTKSPYVVGKKYSEPSSPGSDGISFSVNSSG
ncbi:hypothetical protein UlMin_008899 [Ulmus minor]